MILTARVGKEEGGKRLDEAAAALFPELSRTRIRKIIDWGGCAVGGRMVRVASRIVAEGDEISVGVMEPEGYRELRLEPEEILYEDADFLAVCKGSGTNSQRTPYQLKGTLEHAIALHFRDLGIDEPVRIVHRLDRGTSGVMFFPKNRSAAAALSALLAEGKVRKRYWAAVEGQPPQEAWEVAGPIAKVGKARYGVAIPGRDALSLFRIIARGDGGALVEAEPRTGRTHQLRVHLAHCGLPVAGDGTYGGVSATRLMLHCREMAFVLADGRTVAAVAPVERRFREWCAARGIALPEEEVVSGTS